jgi:hypothetical protein
MSLKPAQAKLRRPYLKNKVKTKEGWGIAKVIVFP